MTVHPGRPSPDPAAGAGEGAADPVSVGREIALRLLTVRARTQEELRRALATRQVPDAAAKQVLSRLAEVGLVDDAAFAHDWIAGQARRHRGRRVLARELTDKGIDRDLVVEAVAGISAEQEYETARRFAERRLPSLAGAAGPVRFRRLAGALARRGFSSDVTMRVVRDVLAGDRLATDPFSDSGADLESAGEDV